jgi:hypothetical protein
MLHKNLSGLGRSVVVKVSLRVNTTRSFRKNGVTKNVVRGVILVVPDERNYHAGLVLEGSGPNSSSIRTQQIVLSGPTTKIRLIASLGLSHFEDLLSLDLFGF